MAEPIIKSITNYKKTQRILLLIDLNPILHLQDPNPYLNSLISTAKTLLSFPSLSSSLFSFKPFFSSLSPLLSSSKLSIPSLSLSFNHPNTTFDSLSLFLSSLLTTVDQISIPSSSSTAPRALHLSASMRQLLHDYAWDPVTNDDYYNNWLPGNDTGMPLIKSNLVVLLSPIIRSLNCLSQFFDTELSDVDVVINKFRDVFISVNDAFVSRDIHFSWIDVKCETALCDFDESRIFVSGIKDLGWGFSSSDCIVLGSALVPFGLIYPRIGISQKFLDFDHSFKPVLAQLNLEILDVNGKPLECKSCDLELVNLNVLSGIKSNLVWDDFRQGISKLHVKAVQKSDQFVHLERFLSDTVIVREFSKISGDRKKGCSEFFEDKVLEILRMEMGELLPRKSVPILQIIFSFLYKEDYWALVSLSNSNGKLLTGILKPFTVSFTLFSILSDQCNPNCKLGGTGLDISVMKTDIEICEPKFDLSQSFGPVGSQLGPSPSKTNAEAGDGKRKKNKRSLNTLQEMTWSDFCKAALEHFDLDLEDVCFTREGGKSKKLKFLKCWMKQIKKSSICSLTYSERSKPKQEILKEIDVRLTKLPQECEQPIASCSSVGEDSLTGASRIQDEAAIGFSSESLESFLNNLPLKIQQGLESDEVDLASLANRLVNSTIYWLYHKYEKEMVSEIQTPVVRSDDPSSSLVPVELTKLLLRDPKDLAAMHRNGELSSQASTEVTSDNIVREYELQILFRMEILQSEVGASIGESTKQKFVKQICLLLENIQCHLQGGFFGDWSLDKYVGKIIKSRYCQSLEDVVQKIYERTDLLLFEDEEELPNALFNSEDSSQSWREKHRREEVDENCRCTDPVSAEDESLKQVESEQQSPQEKNWKEHARKLIEAQERRQRARRFASFTSWVPDLQRVWAPKQSKPMKVKSDHLRKLSNSKRKEGRSSYDRVCETPMSGLKRSCSRGGSSIGEKDDRDYGNSVSKALFQDD